MILFFELVSRCKGAVDEEDMIDNEQEVGEKSHRESINHILLFMSH